jgi:hypothetical protein
VDAKPRVGAEIIELSFLHVAECGLLLALCWVVEKILKVFFLIE